MPDLPTRYCHKCRETLVLVSSRIVRFDPRTREPILSQILQCPKRRWFLDGHAKEYYFGGGREGSGE